MASGHVYRANRPNTWLLRPILQREDSSCRPGAVHTWPKGDMPWCPGNVRFWGATGPSCEAGRSLKVTRSAHFRLCQKGGLTRYYVASSSVGGGDAKA
jgi:hypothetical protein